MGLSRAALARACALALALALALSGCAAPDWPGPDPSRPVVDLTFDVAPDLRSVRGTERVRFVPDDRVCELIFRAWPNKPRTARAGNSLVVTAARVDGAEVTPDVSAAGAPPGHPGTLVSLPLTTCVPAGDAVVAELEFELTLGTGVDERIGVSADGDVAWLGTAFPLLAWVRGRGWATEEAVDVPGEMATSEVFRLRSMEVVVPAEHDVLGAGAKVGQQSQEGGAVAHYFTAPAVRDVTVTVGRIEVREHEVDGTRFHVGTPSAGTTTPPGEWERHLEGSARRLTDLLGPVPYENVWISVLPDPTEGVEYPGAVQFGDLDLPAEDWLVTHELAHLWFYGLVGNNQAVHPWLDESLATFAQRVADGDGFHGEADWGEVGRPMEYWEDQRRPGWSYVEGVYLAGGDALLVARRRSGSRAFDAALGEYLTDNAHRVAEPADLRAALADLPEAVAVLEEAGAFRES